MKSRVERSLRSECSYLSWSEKGLRRAIGFLRRSPPHDASGSPLDAGCVHLTFGHLDFVPENSNRPSTVANLVAVAFRHTELLGETFCECHRPRVGKLLADHGFLFSSRHRIRIALGRILGDFGRPVTGVTGPVQVAAIGDHTDDDEHAASKTEELQELVHVYSPF